MVVLRPALLVRQSLALTRRLRTPMVLDRGKHKRCQRQVPHREGQLRLAGGGMPPAGSAKLLDSMAVVTGMQSRARRMLARGEKLKTLMNACRRSWRSSKFIGRRSRPNRLSWKPRTKRFGHFAH